MLSPFISADKWIAQGITLEDAALETVKSIENTLVIAGPGAGKTELLAQRACFLLQTNTCACPKRILAVSFKKDAASNLSDRVQKRCGKELARRFESMTFDAFSKEILDRFYLSLPAEYQPASNYLIDSNGSLLRLAYQLAGLGDIRINPKNTKHLIPKSVMKIMLKGDVRNDFSPALTFSIISRIVNYLLKCNPLIIQALRATYSHVFLDEFQDTTQVQYELVKTCFQTPEVTLTAVGDKKQRIMIWAGALNNAFEQFVSDFLAIEKTMVMNHRSAPSLITLQKSLYKDLNAADVDILPSSKWQPDEGDAYLHCFNTQEEEAIFIKDRIKGLLDEGVNPRDICILAKHSIDQYAASIIGTIPGKDIATRNESVYQDLLKEDLSQILLATLYCSLKADNPDAYVYVQDIFFLLKSIEIDEDNTVINLAHSRLVDFFDSVNPTILSIRDTRPEDFTAFSDLISTILDFFDGQLVKDYFPQYQNGTYFADTKQLFIDLLWSEYLKTKDWVTALAEFEGINSVPVMTIHKSKGLEFDTVFFIGLEDNAFFSYKSQKNEETCAFFVAISRAKRELHITVSANRSTLTRNAGIQKIQTIKPFYDAIKESGTVEILDHRKEQVIG